MKILALLVRMEYNRSIYWQLQFVLVVGENVRRTRNAQPRLLSQIREVKTMNMAMRGTLAKLKSECDGLKSEIFGIQKDLTVRNNLTDF